MNKQQEKAMQKMLISVQQQLEIATEKGVPPNLCFTAVIAQSAGYLARVEGRCDAAAILADLHAQVLALPDQPSSSRVSDALRMH